MRLRQLSLVGAFLLCGVTSLFGQDDRYTLTIGSDMIGIGETTTLSVVLDAVPGTAGAPDNLGGWSYGVCHDATLAIITDLQHGAASATLNAGMAPAFSSLNTTPVPGDGFTVGVIIDLFGFFFLLPGPAQEVNVVTYERVASGDVTLDFCDTLATPAVETLVVNTAGTSAIPVQVSGLISEAAPPVDYVRGDMNQDGILNITDMVFMALWLFNLGPAGTCDLAADANDDDILTIGDVPFLGGYLFQGGPPPAAPFPLCGQDATPGTLMCDMSICP